MKISFETAAPAVTAEQNTTSHITAGDKGSSISKAGYRLDISGIVKDDKAYDGHGRTGEDVQTQVSRQDLTNAQNYLTVMSNSLSAEDYGKLMEDGTEPSYTEAGTTSTIIDAVKVALIKSGKSIEGYTTDIDPETLARITGSKTYANELTDSFSKYDVPVTKENAESAAAAADIAGRLKPLDDGAVRYLASNDMEPTISNLYEAQYSASGDGTEQPRGYYASDAQGYYDRKADEYDWDQLGPQIDKVISEAGMDDTDNAGEECRWLITRGIPLTTDSLILLDKINSTELPADISTVYDAAASALSDGQSASDGDLADTRDMFRKALDYIDEVGAVTDEAVEKTVSDGTALTLRTLTAAQKSIDAYLDTQQSGTQSDAGNGDDSGSTDNGSGSGKNYADKIKASEMTLASVRLQMTVKTNLILLKSGYSIDTAPIEKLEADLRKAGTQAAEEMFGSASADELKAKYSEYTDAVSTFRTMAGMPAALLGRYSVTDADFTVQGTYDAGLRLQKKYEQAGQTYETVGTSPRADLGDSITKAFSNVDALLEETGMETSDDNRRAVRILGYNSMEITAENVGRVRSADMTMRDVIRRMTPAATLEAVREGVDPLKMNMGELESYLDSSDQSAQQDQTRFGRFIYNMDVSGNITEDERTSCIGIYRLFSQLESGGDAAVGAVVESGREMTFGNLLSAVRSSRTGALDYSIDDSFGGVDGVRQNASITEQIRAAFSSDGQNSSSDRNDGSGDGSDRSRYYKALASDVLSKVTPQKILDAAPQTDTLITDFADSVRNSVTGQDNSSYIADKMQEIQNMHTDEVSGSEIFTYSLPMTIDTISGMQQLRHDRGGWYRTASEAASDSDGDDTEDDVSGSAADSLTDRESAVRMTEKITAKLQAGISDAMESTSLKYVDLKLLHSCSTQLGIIKKLAADENYEIPVEINGEKTSIHLKMIHGSDEKGQVSITMDTEATGRVAAQMKVQENSVSGYIACSSAQTAENLEDNINGITGGLDGRLDVVTSDSLDLDVFEKESDEAYRKNRSDSTAGQNVDNRTLYRLAGAFIRTIAGGTV